MADLSHSTPFPLLLSHRPTLIALTALLGAGSIYLLYQTLSPSTTASSSSPSQVPLHRTNTIYRPHRRPRNYNHHQQPDRQPQPILAVLPPSPESPLGAVVLRRGETAMAVPIAPDTPTSRADVRHVFGASEAEEMYRMLVDGYLDAVLSACVLATTVEWVRERLESAGLWHLVKVVEEKNTLAIQWEVLKIVERGLRMGRDGGQGEEEEAWGQREEGWREGEEVMVAIEAVERLSRSLEYREMLTGRRGDGDAGGRGYGGGGGEDGGGTAMEEMLGETEEEEDGEEEEEGEEAARGEREPSQSLRGLLYCIAEEDAKRKAYEHRGVHCEECGELPIRGIRWHCLNCPSFDLCSTCEPNTIHPKTHVFAKIRIPLPVLAQPSGMYKCWYPGDSGKTYSPLEGATKKRLCRESGFEEPQLDALVDQFVCFANASWPADRTGIQMAIDKSAFRKAFSSDRWPRRMAPNALHDRMFAFYDTDSNGLIGLEELISGVAYLRGKKRFDPIRRAIQGFDFDGDGYIDRGDFLRLLRAKFQIQTYLIHDVVQHTEDEQNQTAVDVLRTNQPISAAFTQEDIPPAEQRPIRGKQENVYGDMRVNAGTDTVLKRKDSRKDDDEDQNSMSDEKETPNPTADEVTMSSQEEANTLKPNGGFHSSSSEWGVADADFLVDSQDQSFYWEIIEDGFNELLNAMFLQREAVDDSYLETGALRRKWRAQIEQVIQTKTDGQMAHGPKSAQAPSASVAAGLDEPRQPPTNEETSGSVCAGGIVPTDLQSLASHEKEISERPLEQLLSSSGYSVIEENGESSMTLQDMSSEISNQLPPSEKNALGYDRDMEFKQNPLGSLADQQALIDETVSPVVSIGSDSEDGPSHELLLDLARLEELERKAERRGGRGRLSYNEIQELILQDRSDQIRGLVKSWLEWASF